MPRPHAHPELDPQQPRTVLGWSLQKQRLVAGWEQKQLAKAFGCSPAHVSRVEAGKTTPSRELVGFYDKTFEADGLLMSLYEAADSAGEQARRREGGHRPRRYHAVPGDASEFVSDTIPHGTLMEPGQVFTKTWTIRNCGSVAWVGRRLERQGPLTGPGLITSPDRFLNVPDTKPGERVTIQAILKAPTYDCTSIAYFKMVDSDGAICFPDSYQLGLDLLVQARSAGQ